jgi:hypothetical protein
VIERLHRDGLLGIIVAATSPAIDIFRESGLCCLAVEEQVDGDRIHDSYPLLTDHQVQKALLNRAQEIIASTKPAVVVTGCSSLGYGVDEAMVLEAARANIPSCTYMDGWGTGNVLGDVRADMLLLAEETAVSFVQGWPREHIRVIGSPRQDIIHQVDTMAERIRIRRELGIDEKGILATFFAQTPLVDGYMENWEALIGALSRFDNSHLLLAVKPHPKYPDHAKDLVRLAAGQGVPHILFLSPGGNEELFAASDLVFIVNSLCGVDHAHFVRRAGVPLGVAVYLCFGDKYRAHLQETMGYERHPYAQIGVGRTAECIDDLAKLLNDACRERRAAIEYFLATKTLRAQGAIEGFTRGIYRLIDGDTTGDKNHDG